MATIPETIKLLSDPTRLRIALLLGGEDLTVAELQEILGMKQARISTCLAQLKSKGLVEVRRSGKNSIYGAAAGVPAAVCGLIEAARGDVPEAARDAAALDLVRRKRADRARQYFDQLAGKFGRTYCPGRSWKGLAESLLELLPPLVIADLGAGEGTFSQLLARRAARVIAIDRSEKMTEFAARVARENGFTNLEFRVGDIEAPPISDASVDLAFFSQALHHAQHPEVAVREAFRIVRPGGRIVVLDLLKHDFEDARDLYADVWLGFAEVDLFGMLRDAGFGEIDVAVVDREPDLPHFQTLLGTGTRPGG